jgi:hypothetical protein
MLTIKDLYICTRLNLAGQHSWMQRVGTTHAPVLPLLSSNKTFLTLQCGKSSEALRWVANILLQGIQDCSELMFSFHVTS